MSNAKTLGVLKHAAIVFLPIVVIASMGNAYNDRLVIASNLKVLQEQQKNLVAMQKHSIQNTFENIISDLEVVSLHSDLKQLLSHSSVVESAQHKQDLGREFLAFIHHKEIYDQLRILNKDGKELIRAERYGQSERLVPDNELQNKSSRSYFIAAMHGEPETVYVSSISLNVERGQVDEPYKPVIQLSMSLGNQEEEIGGVLVLNYLAEHLFETLNRHSLGLSGVTQLVDSNGFWIEAVNENDEWGGVLDGREDRAFRLDYSEAWGTISESKSGQFINADGVFTFSKINPFEMHHRQGHSQTSYIPSQRVASNTWILLSHIPSKSLEQMLKNKGSVSYINQIILTLSLFILSLLFSQKRVEHIENTNLIKQKDIRLRAVVDMALDGIITIDKKGVISSANPAACKMFGYEESEMLGQNVSMIVPSPHKEVHDDYLIRHLETREGRDVNKTREVDAERKDGSVFPVELCVGAKELDGSWLFTGIIRDITERKLLTEKLEKMAISDALTGVYNRGYFTTKLKDEFLRSKRYDLNLSLIMLDLDHFKAVNDEYGHPVGDAMLIAVAHQIQKSIRTIDVLARYGGEEFAIIMPETDCDGAQVIAERIRHDIEAMEVDIGSQVIKKTVSVGIASFTSENTELADTLLVRADDALYQAKHSGRNRVVLYGHD